MAGSIRARPDKAPDAWELRVFVGRDTSGRVRHRSRLFHGTERQAERELARMVVAQEDEPALVPTEESRRWGPSTTWRYASIVETHVRDSIGRRTIASVRPEDVEVYLRQLKARGLSEASVRQTRALLHRACRLARKWSGNVLPNPINGTELPDWKLSEQRDAVRAPTLEEVQKLLAGAKERDERLHAYLLVTAATGMRRGEVCGLRWSDVGRRCSMP